MEERNPAPLSNDGKRMFADTYRENPIIPLGFLGGATWISSIRSIYAPNLFGNQKVLGPPVERIE